MNETHVATHGTLDAHRRVTVVGAGVIGSSWTALFLAKGLTVTVTDPLPDMDRQVHDQLQRAIPALRALGLPTTDLDRNLRFEADLGKAVADADVVQENGPERLDVKQDLFTRIEHAARPDALLLSSTSGIRATDIAQALRQPERLVIGHPFNPPHLIPLVEIVPARRPVRRWSSALSPSTRRSARSRRSCARRCRVSSPTGCRQRCFARP